MGLLSLGGGEGVKLWSEYKMATYRDMHAGIRPDGEQEVTTRGFKASTGLEASCVTMTRHSIEVDKVRERGT